MRSYLLASLALHVALTVALGVLSRAFAPAPPPADLLQVNLATLSLPTPAREESAPPVTPAPTPEEPAPIPAPPEEIAAEPPALDPDPAPPEDPTPEEVAPRPDLPPAPAPPPTTPPLDEEFLEPERVKPRKAAQPPVPTPPPDPTPPADDPPASESEEGPAPETVGTTGSVQARSPEGVEDFYLARVQTAIGRRWNPSTAAAGGRTSVETQVSFRIEASGRVREVQVVRSSGLSVFDREGLRAIYAADPLPPLPPRFRHGDGIEIVFYFVYSP